MRFPEFLRSAVTISVAAATLLAIETLAGANGNGETTLVLVAVVWWAAAAGLGLWIGRGRTTSRSIGRLLSGARTQASLPELNPARTMLNRLWPLLACAIGAGAVAFAYPQVPAIASGFAIIWAFAWRHQASAVTAIEERDGARFYIDRTSPFQAIRLVRTPGFRSNLTELGGAQRSSGVAGRRA
jgi:hypothetical protein